MGMEQFYVDFLDNLADLHAEIMKTIRHLPSEALDWVPFPGGNSLSILVIHVAGAEKFWMGDVVAGEPSHRDRPAEFKARGFSISQLESKLNESLGYAELVLGKFTLADLSAPRIHPRNEQEITAGWALEHTLKHTALHLGHLEITRQLWDQSSSSTAGN